MYIEAVLLLDCRNVAGDSSHMLTPVLGDSTHRMELPLVLVVGKRRYWALLRALWGLGSHVLRDYKIHNILKARDGRFIRYRYRVQLGYEAWMETAAVSLAN